jgi:hypothetical protein
MDENNRKHRSSKYSPLRALHSHQSNVIWKRKRNSNNTQETLGDSAYKRSKYNFHHQGGMKNSCYGNKLASVNPESMMELDAEARTGTAESCGSHHVHGSQGCVTCIYCRNWSGSLGDFAWHLNQAHGIPGHVAKCILSKMVDQFEKSKSCSTNLGLGKLVHLNSNENVDVNAETFQAMKFLNAHYKCIPQAVFDHQQSLSDCE